MRPDILKRVSGFLLKEYLPLLWKTVIKGEAIFSPKGFITY